MTTRIRADFKPKKGKAITVKLDGAEQLLEELEALGVNVQRSLRGAIRKGAKVIQDEAEVNARMVTGKTGKHTRLHVSTRRGEVGSSDVQADIGPSKKKFWLRFYETGAAPHEIKAKNSPLLAFEGEKGLVLTSRVAHPGLPALPWLRPAFDNKGDAAIKVVGEVLREAVEEARIAAEGSDDEE